MNDGPSFSHLRRRFRQTAQTDFDKWVRRAELQLKFAKEYSEIQPEPTRSTWLGLVAEAKKLLAPVGPNLESLKDAVAYVEHLLAPIGRAAKSHTIFCVGHGHIDMNWMWSWPETVAATHDTFASVLRLMDEYPEVTYSQSQTSVYDIVEKHFPEIFEGIKKRVKEGRWEVTAAHWVEGDKNIASGEALCRHLLYTREYFQEKFGLSAEDVPIDWEPDTFGHANTIPTILTRAGVKYYYCCRPGGGEGGHERVGGPRPQVFWWQAPDGSCVLVYQEQTWYNSYVGIGEDIAEPLIRFVKETGLRDWMNVYGLGNHGGGPTRQEIDYYLEAREWPIYPTIQFGTFKAFMDSIVAQVEEKGIDIPVLDHELNFEFTGCYTSQSLIKQANRFGENQMVEAETLSWIANKSEGMPYPTELLREGWINTLFNHFHDILPGSGVRETRDRALGMFQDTAAIAGAIKRRSGIVLTKGIDTASLLPDTPEGNYEAEHLNDRGENRGFEAGPGAESGTTGFSAAATGGRLFRPFVLYNPCAWPRREVVTLSVYDADFDVHKAIAIDETGHAEPVLCLSTGGYWGHGVAKLAFVAEVPALGYRTYLVTEGTADSGGVEGGPWAFTVDGTTKVGFDRHGSGLVELADPGWAAALASRGSKPFGEWRYVKEQPQGMNAWVLGGFTLQPEPLRTVSARRWSNGRIAVVERHLEVPGTHSTVKLTGAVAAGCPMVSFQAELDWREIGGPTCTPSLVIGFPLPSEAAGAVYETPFGTVQRPSYNGSDVPSLRFAHPIPNGSPAGSFTVLQDCKYGHALLDGPSPEMTLRVVRSSHEPDHAPEVAKSTVRYGVVWHKTAPSNAELVRTGAAFNHPILVLPADMARGDKATVRSFARCETPGVVLTSLKGGHGAPGTVLRLVETEGKSCQAEVHLDPVLGSGRATVVDVLEKPTEGRSELVGGVLKVDLAPNSIVTVRVD